MIPSKSGEEAPVPYQNSSISSQAYGFAEPATSQKSGRAPLRPQTGDRFNRVLVDLVGFASLLISLSFPSWSAAFMSSSNSFIFVADQLAWAAFVSVAMLLIVRSSLNLLDHSGDAVKLAATSLIGSFGLISSAGASAASGGILSAIATALFCAAGAALCRLVIGIVVTRQTRLGCFKRRIAIYGATEESAHCLNHLAGEKSKVFAGLFDERKGQERVRDFGIEIKGDLDDLVALAASRGVDEVIIAMPEGTEERVAAIAERLSDYPVHLRSPAAMARVFLKAGERFQLSKLGNVELAAVATRPLEGWNLVLKEIQDRVGAAVLMVLFSPIMMIIAVAIKLDSAGPVFFRQRRHGLCGQSIIVWKFRTMSVLEDGDTILQAQSRDPRVTRVGRLLRKSSLDELPQLINVLLGDMSLVGPRPHAIAHNEYYAGLIRTYNGRHRLKPGITGWAQINGLRGEISEPSQMKKRVEHDHWYIQNCSIWLDLKILLLTPVYGFFNRNAY